MADDLSRAKELFALNKRVLAIMGVWPLESTYVKFAVWIVYIMIHISMLLNDLYHVFGNLELLILNLMETTYVIMIIGKMLVMGFSRTLPKLTRQVIAGLDTKLFDGTEEIEIYLKYNRIATIVFEVGMTIAIIVGIFYNLQPLEFRLRAGNTYTKLTAMTYIEQFHSRNFLSCTIFLKIVLQNETMPFVLSYRTRLFFEVTDASTFWLVWIYQFPMTFPAIFHPATIGYLITLVLHVCGQLSVLAFKIKNLNGNPCKNDESFRAAFRVIVDRHCNILEIARDINEVFGILLLEELFITTPLMGLIFYSILENVGFEETGVFISYVLYAIIMFSMIYGYCFAGEYLIHESTNLYEAYYQCQWYDMSDSVKKQLIICMIGAYKPIYFNAGGIYIFCSASFTSILKTSMGYISMLRAMD